MQPDFEKFVDRNTPDARINNFTRLQVSDRGSFDRRRARRDRRRGVNRGQETRAPFFVPP